MTDNRERRVRQQTSSKAGNGSGTWFRKKNGSIRVEITVLDAEGHRVRKTKTVHGGSGEMGRKNFALKDLHSQYPDGRVPDPGQTVAECLQDWCDRYLAGIAGSTADNYRTMVNKHISPALGTTFLTELTTADVNRFLLEMATAERGENRWGDEIVGYAKNTIRLAKKVLGMGLEHARSEDRVSRNVARDAKVPESAERSTRSFTLAEVKAFREAAASDRLWAAWFIQLGLGLRPGEVLALSWDDVVDVDLHVRHGQRREAGQLLPRDRMKTLGSMRVLEMPNGVMESITARRVAQEDERNLAAEAWSNPLNLIFTTELGDPIRPETYRRRFLSLLDTAGIDSRDVTPHTLRHTAASHLVDAGVPLGTISDMLGHVDLTMLVKKYRHRTTSRVTGHVAAMDEVLGANSSEHVVSTSSYGGSNAALNTHVENDIDDTNQVEKPLIGDRDDGIAQSA